MRNKKKLLLEQLDYKLQPFSQIKKIPVPHRGWIHAIRVTINMTLEQLGKRLNITKQSVKGIEEREISGAVSIKMLKEVAEALDMQFVYGFAPKQESIEKMVESKARELAIKIVQRTNLNMQLENQGNSNKRIIRAIDELTNELKREMRKSIWD